MERRTLRASNLPVSARRGVVVFALASVLSVASVLAQPHCAPSAHRGEHTKAFDNSVEAIRAAAGLPYVEVDVRLTADNDLVLFHDRRLSPKNVRGDDPRIGRSLSSLSRGELAEVRYPDGSKIPRLRSALREAKERGIILMLDVKGTSPRDFKRVMDEVRESQGESRVVVQCQTREILEYMREDYPKVAVLARAHSEGDVEALLGYAPDFVQIDDTWNLTALVPRIHARGARAVVKTLTPETDLPQEWRRICEVGVDIVLTDRPRDLVAARDTWKRAAVEAERAP